MTDQEKTDLSERIAILAESAGLSAELLWEAAETCPQGHSTRDIECGYVELSVGDLCRECWTEEWRNPRLEVCETDAEIHAVMDEERAALHQFKDPTFHPEWRIGKVAKDFADPANLLAVVEAWRAQRRWRGWSVYTPVAGMFPDIEQATAIVVKTSRHFEAVGETPWVALAQAFAEALEKGVAE